jgi:hypothetical protein
MKTFTKRLDDLREEGFKELHDLINSKGVESKHSGKKCLKVTKEEHQLNLDGDRYLTEINSEFLVDNSGYEYSYYALALEDLIKVIDYLIAKNKKK